MAVALRDLGHAVQTAAPAALHENTGVFTKTHGAALVRHAGLIWHQADNGVLDSGRELGGVGVLPVQHMAGELHHRHLHAKADTKVGDPLFPGVLNGADHAFDTAAAETAGHQHTAAARQAFLCVLRG